MQEGENACIINIRSPWSPPTGTRGSDAKEVFVLGVYASAVHARWTAMEDCLQRAGGGERAAHLLGWQRRRGLAYPQRHKNPEGVGELVLPMASLNGPSAKALDERILAPLGLTRQDAWLCDLLPESRLNPNQLKVIAERYNPLIERYGLNPVTVPPEDGIFCDDVRRKEITAEIHKSKAEMLILLGDMPIRQYLRHVEKVNFSNLREYTQRYGYGAPLPVEIASRKLNLLPLAHPRQISQLGRSSISW
jgi:hypothetical protein